MGPQHRVAATAAWLAAAPHLGVGRGITHWWPIPLEMWWAAVHAHLPRQWGSG